MKQIYAVVELGRIGEMISQKSALKIFDFYPDLKEAHQKLLNKHFNVNLSNFIVTPRLIECFEGGSNQEYAQELLTYSSFERFETELTFEEKVELAKGLLEIDMMYKAKQKELNSQGLYIHFHEIMSFHRKLMQGLTG